MIHMKKLISLCICMVISFSLFAQQSITLSDLWQKYSFYAGGIGGLRSMNDGKHYSASTKKTIDKYSYQTGEKVATLLDITTIEELEGFGGYAFNADETGAILQTETESIYRYSSRSVVWLANFSSGTAQKLRDEKVRYATYSPDGNRVAYVLDNNLFVYSIR